jgi:hypothetical protein
VLEARQLGDIRRIGTEELAAIKKKFKLE